ncbi:hypothetical protein OLP40_04910 [Campylobacter jejuni]|nr:hypothetical protein C414_000420021 [Campylobacter jejuni subsp. jejuni 414]MCW1333615.1 hypothetical protein [Campylobacter jejuni]MCW1359522.1 hypothetical protein [Campylobacter jejuni]HDZ4932655.1 hypothetical protein [Campylobacter jejuni]HDZ4937408.1 hypothetical protein [Campylobacter jejuni]
MDFKQRHDEFVKEYEIAMSDKSLSMKALNPYKAKVKIKQTYKDDNKK